MTGKPFNKDSVALVYITILTVIAVVYGFTIIPSPAKAQSLAFDHKRVVDLGTLQADIDSYYQDNGTLPKTLNDLPSNSADQVTQTTSIDKTDPQTKQPYVYQVTDPLHYKLCATFATDSTKEDPNSYDSNNPDYSTYTGNFKHEVGYKCFDEHENDNSNIDITPPTDYPVDSGSPTPVPNPTAALTSFDKTSTCSWTPTFTLRGFAPYSNITVNSQGTLSDNCNASKTHAYSWSGQWNSQTDQNGEVTVDYLQNDYGNYTYTFTDDQGNTASVHFSYDQSSSLPTILPAGNKQGGGGGGGIGYAQ